MLGVDLVDLTRFETTSRLQRFCERFQVDGNTAMAAAKTWACLEAIVKAEDQPFEPTRISIRFPKHQRPEVYDPDQVLSGSYVLSVSHQGQMIIAVALRA